ncbi:MAG: hydrogenase nickel incorporation protein HypB [Candidatus Marinimicrobia bacterium]|nr:hydrogenase nickel incorporation protein HypB [Candidatus Neomarinimicrobiota bacterium]
MQEKEIKVMKKILATNDRMAMELRKTLKEKGILFINLMSSPGSGKTSLLEKTAKHYNGKIAVIEGDIETTLDAQRIANAGLISYQINTGPFGGDCHLESGWVKSALEEIDMTEINLLFVENIGNLVCPAEFDVGAHINTVLISTTEGEDKPLKYPLAFQNSSLCIITKTDLIPYLDFNLTELKDNIKKVNPKIKILELSSKTDEKMGTWIDFLNENKFN